MFKAVYVCLDSAVSVDFSTLGVKLQHCWHTLVLTHTSGVSQQAWPINPSLQTSACFPPCYKSPLWEFLFLSSPFLSSSGKVFLLLLLVCGVVLLAQTVTVESKSSLYCKRSQTTVWDTRVCFSTDCVIIKFSWLWTLSLFRNIVSKPSWQQPGTQQLCVRKVFVYLHLSYWYCLYVTYNVT